MTSLALLLKLTHVLTAFWFIAGLVGRQVCLTRAARSPDVNMAYALSELSGVFESHMVIPGSLAVFVLGLLTAWAQGWPLLGFLQGSQVNWVLASIVLYLSLVPLVIWVFLPRGRKFAAALQDALAQGQVTPALRAAFHDPVVAIAHAYEVAAVAAIVVLMVTKPF